MPNINKRNGTSNQVRRSYSPVGAVFGILDPSHYPKGIKIIYNIGLAAASNFVVGLIIISGGNILKLQTTNVVIEVIRAIGIIGLIVAMISFAICAVYDLGSQSKARTTSGRFATILRGFAKTILLPGIFIAVLLLGIIVVGSMIIDLHH